MSARQLAIVGRNRLTHNEQLAKDLRARFREAGVYVTSVMASPGAGKTLLYERTLEMLLPSYELATIAADPAGDLDEQRLSRWNVPVHQVTTGRTPHLDAAMIDRALEGWRLDDLDFLLIENVGNLVCPSAYDLGEDLRVVVVSVTEGEDKPIKYPATFSVADAVVITKMDLADAVGFDGDALYTNIERVRPGIPAFEVSAKTGWGIKEYVSFLEMRKLERTLEELGPLGK